MRLYVLGYVFTIKIFYSCFIFVFCRKKFNVSYLSNEKAFGLSSIKVIYEFLHEKHQEFDFNSELTCDDIIEKGINKTDNLCNLTINFFLDLYATEIGNMVCREKIVGGVYLVGNFSVINIYFIVF